MRIGREYQGRAKAFTKAGLAPNIFRSIKEIWKKVDASKLNNDAKQ